jgi:hypothetical protein
MYNTKAEGHRGEAARLEILAQQLEMRSAAQRKEIAAEYRARAAAHWAKAAEADGVAETFAELAEDVEAFLS